jgi:hypothetical protein
VRARVLFLDDSGKPSPLHASKAVVVGGFAVDAEAYPVLSRRILGAKRRYFPTRGTPQAWEIKTAAIVKPNPWKRRKNREFCAEVVRLLTVSGCTSYAVTLDKQRMNHPMTLDTTMPLQLQALVEHFGAECAALGRVGMVVADWSSQHHDQHASRCVASYVASKRINLHPGVYYASSHGSEGIKVADLLAGVRRRAHEGDTNLADLDRDVGAVRCIEAVGRTVNGRTFTNRVDLF